MNIFKEYAVETVVVFFLVLAGAIIYFIPRADFSDERNIAKFYNVRVVNLEKNRSGKSMLYHVTVNGNSVSNFRFNVNARTWETLYIGEEVSFEYDTGWNSVYQWK